MKNVFWYYGVAAIGIILVIFTFYKKKQIANLLSFLLAVTSLAYLCEIVILFVLDAYQYKPKVFSDPIAEDIFGHLVCNGCYWGGFSLLTATFSLRYYWILLISTFFVLTEIIFIKMDLYTHHWWKLYMTGVGSFIFLLVAKKWFSQLQKKTNKVLRYFTFYCISWLLLAGPSIVLLLLGKQHYNIGEIKNTYLNHIAFAVPYNLGMSFVCIFFINFLKKPYWNIVPFFVALIGDILLSQTNILLFQDGWNLFYLTLVRSIGLSIYISLENHTLRIGDRE